MTQSELFAPYQPHSETSKQAAKSVEPNIASWEGKVLAAIREAGYMGLTDDEGIRALKLNPSTYRPRRVSLWHKRLIAPCHFKRLTESGRQAQVWIAAQSS